MLSPLTVHRVNWLRKKAYRDRWLEELELLQCEMVWIGNYFKYQSKEWKLLAIGAGVGKSCSAFKTSEMWDHLHDYALARFENRGDVRELMTFEEVIVPQELTDHAGVERHYESSDSGAEDTDETGSDKPDESMGSGVPSDSE